MCKLNDSVSHVTFAQRSHEDHQQVQAAAYMSHDPFKTYTANLSFCDIQ